MDEPHVMKMIERFERRIEEIEAQIKPQLDEARALRAGLSRLRREADLDRAVETGASDGPPHGNQPRRTARQPSSARRRR